MLFFGLLMSFLAIHYSIVAISSFFHTSSFQLNCVFSLPLFSSIYTISYFLSMSASPCSYSSFSVLYFVIIFISTSSFIIVCSFFLSICLIHLLVAWLYEMLAIVLILHDLIIWLTILFGVFFAIFKVFLNCPLNISSISSILFNSSLSVSYTHLTLPTIYSV